jgi:hypothetical protein
MTRLAAVGVAAIALGGASVPSAGTGPLAVLGTVSSSGYPLAGGGPSGTSVRFIAGGTFWVAVLVRNRSAHPVTLIAARTPEPAQSLVRQTRAGFSTYKPCTGSIACVWPSSPTSTRPLTLPAHGEAAVKLSYQLVSCAAAATGTTASSDALVLAYRLGNGQVRQETGSLGGAHLLLQRPAGEACLARPFSHIGLVGSFTTSPGHLPIPGSDGDTCTRTAAGGLAFESREFMDRSGVEFRIELALARYHGLGGYSRATVTAIGGFGLHSTTTFIDRKGTASIVTAGRRFLAGSFTAVFSGHRRFFRGYGAWRCRFIG